MSLSGPSKGFDVAEESSTQGLIRGILDDLRDLVREEIALARAEVREELGRAKDAALSAAIGVALLAVGGLFLLTFVALGLADLRRWPAWTGFLIVGVILSVIGAVMGLRAQRKMRRVNPGLPKTTASLKENAEWIESRTTPRRTTSEKG